MLGFSPLGNDPLASNTSGEETVINGELFTNDSTFFDGEILGGYDGNPNGGKSNPITTRFNRAPVVGVGGGR